MKSLIIITTSLLVCMVAGGQGIGIGTNTPSNSAVLEIASTIKGLLAPRMTTAQRTAIVGPVKGLLVYDTDLNSLYHYNGAAWAAVGGGGGGLTLPYAATPGLAGAAFKIDNLGTAIQGLSSNASASAITGVSTGTNGYGLIGQNQDATGTGTAGFSTNGTALYGFSSGAGTAIRGLSTSGYALLTSGNVRISGGNTSPAAGAVLTSIDANGNAVWKERKVGFSVRNANFNLRFVPSGTSYIVHFAQEDYDYGNDFNLYTGSTPTFGNSAFVAPVTGLYHFDASITLYKNDNVETPSLRLHVIRAGVPNFEPVKAEFSPDTRVDINKALVMGSFSKDIRLVAGDIITLRVYHYSGGSAELDLGNADAHLNFFDCHLVFAE